MFDKIQKPSLGEDLRKGAVTAFLIAVVAPAIAGVAAAATEGNKPAVVTELRETKQRSLAFVDIAKKLLLIAVGAFLLLALIRLGIVALVLTAILPH